MEDGRVSGNPSGVRSGRLSSVTVCQSDDDDEGSLLVRFVRREDQLFVSDMVVLTPVALCVPSTPAEIGDATDAEVDALSSESPFFVVDS